MLHASLKRSRLSRALCLYRSPMVVDVLETHDGGYLIFKFELSVFGELFNVKHKIMIAFEGIILLEPRCDVGCGFH